MKSKVFRITGALLVLLVAGTVALSAGGQTTTGGLPVVGISTGSSGTSWRKPIRSMLRHAHRPSGSA